MKPNVDLTEARVFEDERNINAIEDFIFELEGKKYPWSISILTPSLFGEPRHAIFLGTCEDRKRWKFFQEGEDGFHCLRCGGTINTCFSSVLDPSSFMDLCQKCNRQIMEEMWENFDTKPHFDFLFGLNQSPTSQDPATPQNLLDAFL